jgi:hypothetical protein
MASIRSDERHDRISTQEWDIAAEDRDQGYDLGYSDAEAGKPQNVPTWLNKDIQEGYRTGYAQYDNSYKTYTEDDQGNWEEVENSPYFGGSV